MTETLEPLNPLPVRRDSLFPSETLRRRKLALVMSPNFGSADGGQHFVEDEEEDESSLAEILPDKSEEVTLQRPKKVHIPKHIFARLTVLTSIMLIEGLANAINTPFIAVSFKMFSADSVWSGVFFSLAFGVGFVASFFLGPLGDRWGQQNIIILVSLLKAFGSFIFMFTRNVPLALFCAILMGVGRSSGPCLAEIGSMVDKDTRTTVFGITNGIAGIGFIIGPLIGPMVSTLIHTPFYEDVFGVAGVLYASNAILAFFLVKDLNKERVAKRQRLYEQGQLWYQRLWKRIRGQYVEPMENVKFTIPFSLYDIFQDVKQRDIEIIFQLALLLMANAIVCTVWPAWNVVLPLTAIISRPDRVAISIVFATAAAAGVVTSIAVVPLMAKLFAAPLIAIIGQAVLTTGTLAITFGISDPSPNWLVLVLMFLCSAGVTIVMTAITSALSLLASEGNQGLYLSLGTISSSFGYMLMPVIASALFNGSPRYPWYFLSALQPLGLIALIILYVLRLIRRK